MHYCCCNYAFNIVVVIVILTIIIIITVILLLPDYPDDVFRFNVKLYARPFFSFIIFEYES